MRNVNGFVGTVNSMAATTSSSSQMDSLMGPVRLPLHRVLQFECGKAQSVVGTTYEAVRRLF